MLTLGIGWAIYRTHLAYLLGLERQRTRIAMDLHDEFGSGLASVGILSSVLARDGLQADERRRAAVEIASAADELGNALSDIVWSLDPHTATLAELAARLAEHGERLCLPGEIAFGTRFPEHWPPERLDVALRRNVLLVGLEALHNAARHAQATEVQLSILPSAGQWQLSIRDDGRGIERAPRNGRGGHGLPGMRRRADEIGAQLIVESAPNCGTNLILRFRLRRGQALASRLRRAFAGPA